MMIVAINFINILKISMKMNCQFVLYAIIWLDHISYSLMNLIMKNFIGQSKNNHFFFLKLWLKYLF